MNRIPQLGLDEEFRSGDEGKGASVAAPLTSIAHYACLRTNAPSRLFLASTLTFLLGATASGQVMQPPGTFQGHGHLGFPNQQPNAQQAGTPQNQSVPPPQGAGAQAAPTPSAMAPASSSGLPASVLDHPAEAAKVDLAGGKLTIAANNSSLSAILNQLSTSAGMTVDGMNKDQRIFGTYGPGDPREILSALLDGTGYNIVMFGKTTAGTPSQLTLSPRGASAGSAAAGGMRNSVRSNQDDEDEEPAPTQYQDNQPPPQPAPSSPGPGVPGQPNGGVRTPQQILQDMQSRQQQQQAQPPEQQQP
ncbi:hypothetical protein HNQ77_004666 [Silvibacterium bohemicum]|uniref:Uncharacterized protein n=1 Tax=Silvibacterium bohemicum TaxID=1577686 RepID=A0A841K270_9BACT|nr:hypothetical protein [Silvibacterium bohemicum]MBB6146687.1 hypothetical protein [Silvibacterium bohemicum]